MEAFRCLEGMDVGWRKPVVWNEWTEGWGRQSFGRNGRREEGGHCLEGMNVGWREPIVWKE